MSEWATDTIAELQVKLAAMTDERDAARAQNARHEEYEEQLHMRDVVAQATVAKLRAVLRRAADGETIMEEEAWALLKESTGRAALDDALADARMGAETVAYQFVMILAKGGVLGHEDTPQQKLVRAALDAMVAEARDNLAAQVAQHQRARGEAENRALAVQARERALREAVESKVNWFKEARPHWKFSGDEVVKAFTEVLVTKHDDAALREFGLRLLTLWEYGTMESEPSQSWRNKMDETLNSALRGEPK